MQAYHIKEMASFSKDSLSEAATILEPVSNRVASPKANRASVAHQQMGALVVPEPTRKQGSLKQISSRSSITPMKSNQLKLENTSKFDHVFSWAALPVAPRMLQHQRTRICEQAASAFRLFDKDGNSKLSSVEFFEGMTSSGLSRDQVLHLMNIHKPKQPGFYHLDEFEDIFMALYPPEEAASQVRSNLEPVDGDEDICVVLDSPISDRNHPNPTPLTQKNAGIGSTFCWNWTVVAIGFYIMPLGLSVSYLTQPAEALRSRIEVIDTTMRQLHSRA